jgi:hypothetical protein
MAKKRTKRGEKDTKSRKVRDLPAKSLGATKAASVRGGKPAGDPIPTESISISYGKIKFDY